VRDARFQMRHAEERPAGNIHGCQKAVTLDVDHSTVEGFPRRKRDRMNDKVELSPFLLNSLKYRFHLAWDLNVERHEDRCFELARERLDILHGLVVQVSHGQIGPERSESLGAAPSNRLVVGDADDQALASPERDLGLFIDGNCHDTLSCCGDLAGLFDNSDHVCRAIISSSSVGST
jgi:hypothetical protein